MFEFLKDMLNTIFFSGVLVPGGFGSRGAEGKILAAKWARENKKPYLGKIGNLYLKQLFL